MHRAAVHTRLRRLAATFTVIGALMSGAAPGITASVLAHDDGPSAADLRAAESHVLAGINEQRADHGLRAIRLDSRVQAVAEARSQDMADRDYFNHQDPDGKWPWDHLDDAGITWYHAGEIIAWNMTAPVSSSGDTAIAQWMASKAGHREQILSTVDNYAGVGAAVDGERTYWTVVFIQGPDRTAPTASVAKASSSKGSGKVSLDWTGSDPKLVVLTAGLAGYDVARRRPGGTWTTLASNTNKTKLSFKGTRGQTWQVRVRAHDKAGNVGSWSASKSVTVR